MLKTARLALIKQTAEDRKLVKQFFDTIRERRERRALYVDDSVDDFVARGGIVKKLQYRPPRAKPNVGMSRKRRRGIGK